MVCPTSTSTIHTCTMVVCFVKFFAQGKRGGARIARRGAERGRDDDAAPTIRVSAHLAHRRERYATTGGGLDEDSVGRAGRVFVSNVRTGVIRGVTDGGSRGYRRRDRRRQPAESKARVSLISIPSA